MSFVDNDIASLYPRTIRPKVIPSFEKVDEAVVDGEQWYSVRTRRGSEAGKWLREQECAVETSTGWSFDSYFDVPEKIYMMLVLRFL
jgi:hypothetical protein